jgi:alpha-D-ribose 1-methylphosphonate 5-triphosphate synthase subunit PhnG
MGHNAESVSQELHLLQQQYPGTLYLELEAGVNGTVATVRNRYGGESDSFYLRKVDVTSAAMTLAARGHKVKIVP